MAVFPKLFPKGAGPEVGGETQAASADKTPAVPDIAPVEAGSTGDVLGGPEFDEKAAVPSQDAQLGVQKIEAVTLAWTKKSLAGLLVKYGILFFSLHSASPALHVNCVLTERAF